MCTTATLRPYLFPCPALKSLEHPTPTLQNYLGQTKEPLNFRLKEWKSSIFQCVWKIGIVKKFQFLQLIGLDYIWLRDFVDQAAVQNSVFAPIVCCQLMTIRICHSFLSMLMWKAQVLINLNILRYFFFPFFFFFWYILNAYNQISVVKKFASGA